MKVTANPETDEEPDVTDAEETAETTPSTEPTPKPKSEKEVYYEYLNKELVPKYGLVKLNQEGTLTYFSGVDNPLLDKRNQWLKPVGILSAYIKDLDQDGKKEEEVVYEQYGTKEEYPTAYDTVEEAYIGYFKREKPDVSEIANGYQFYYNELGEETAFIDNLNKTKGATLLCTVNTWTRNSGGNSSENQKYFFFTGKDKTKLRKHITKK